MVARLPIIGVRFEHGPIAVQHFQTAHMPLGFLAFERGEMPEATERFARAVEHDPGFADAHFNLAMALESLGEGARAKPHWRTYLELDPDGPWAEIAEKHLRGDWR